MTTPTIEQAGLSRNAFLNAVRIIYSMEPDLPAAQQQAFRDSPFEFLMRVDEASLTKIWEGVQARQPEKYKQGYAHQLK
ncbi:MAG TPA: hypothetical protein VG519_13265 [Pseudochrobactrum sp.]|nr:hypothetical protein [Pseudochrobactrum sp.]